MFRRLSGFKHNVRTLCKLLLKCVIRLSCFLLKCINFLSWILKLGYIICTRTRICKKRHIRILHMNFGLLLKVNLSLLQFCDGRRRKGLLMVPLSQGGGACHTRGFICSFAIVRTSKFYSNIKYLFDDKTNLQAGQLLMCNQFF